MTAPYLLDCDTGIDDSMAIAELLGEPSAEVVAITSVYGNVAVDQAARNTLDLLDLLGRRDIEVFVGAEHPTTAEFGGGAPDVHGHNGVGNIELPRSARMPASEPAAKAIVRLAREHSGRLNLVAVGPLTNIADALKLEPELPSMINSLTIMGGAALAPGNITALAEANIAGDPEASAAVFGAAWQPTLVPLDVTMHHILEETDRAELLATGRPGPVAIGQMLDCYFDFYTPIQGRPCSVLHDPLAVAIATGRVVPSVAPLVRVSVDDTRGPGRGQTICDLRGRYNGYPEQSGANARVVLELAKPYAPMLMERLLTA